jgi:sporulation protein YtfJ
MGENGVRGIMDTAMEKLRAVVDADTIIGTPLTVGEVTLVPVSKISFGVATGGSDLPNKNNNQLFGGGGGAGASVTPIAFIAVSGSDVKMLPIYNDMNTVDKAISMAPELIEKVKELFTNTTEIKDYDEL